MDENSGTSKKLRANKVIPLPSPDFPVESTNSKTKRRAVRGQAAKIEANGEPMRVIEGGARKRDPDIKDHVGRQLKAVYDDVLKQPVPSRFMDLLNELATKTKSDGK